MTPAEEQAVAERAGVPTAVLYAIRQVESGGHARAVGFETRLFLRETGQTVVGHDRAAFERAFSMNPAAAVKSTSWGLYQVLGTPLIRIYGSPQAGVAAFDADPERVSGELVVAFFEARPAARQAAITGDWMTLARLYNGSDQTPWHDRFVHYLAQYQPPSSLARGAALALGLTVAVGAGLYAWSRSRARR